jgi:hypothetical protein
MVTIHNLEVRLEVEGQGDEAIFIRYFDKYINIWHRRMEELKARMRQAEVHRSLGDRQPEGDS